MGLKEKSIEWESNKKKITVYKRIGIEEWNWIKIKTLKQDQEKK